MSVAPAARSSPSSRARRRCPTRLSMPFVTIVATISRRSRWRAIAVGAALRSGSGKYRSSSSAIHGSSAEAARDAVRRRARSWRTTSSTASSGRVSPTCSLRRSASCLVVGQELQRPVEPALLLEAAHEAPQPVEQRRALLLCDRDRLRLQVVVAQHELGRPRRSCPRAAGRAASRGSASPARSRSPSRILMLTSWSEQSTPAELSSASVLRRTPRRAASMRPRCVSARLAPSPTTRARSCVASTRSASLARSPASACGLGARLDVRADAAEPEQLHVGLEHGVDQLVGRDLRLPDAEQLAHPRGDRDRLARCARRRRRPREISDAS